MINYLAVGFLLEVNNPRAIEETHEFGKSDSVDGWLAGADEVFFG